MLTEMLSWIQTIQNAQQRMMAARLQYSLSSKGPVWADEVDKYVLFSYARVWVRGGAYRHIYLNIAWCVYVCTCVYACVYVCMIVISP